MTVTVQIFSDYTSPYCLIGESSLQQATLITGAELVHRAFLLPREDISQQGNSFAEIFRNSVLPLAEQAGMKLSPPSRLPLTRPAHEAAAWARTQGRFTDFHHELFRALFIEDKDFSEIAVLRQIAHKLRLDPDELEAALAEKKMTEDIDEDLLIGQSYGIRMVPACVIGGQILFGSQEAAVLIEAIHRAERMEPAASNNSQPPILINITRR